jgi:hypothetical protein
LGKGTKSISTPASPNFLRTGYKIHVSPSASRHSCEIISRAVAASRDRFERALQRSKDRGLTDLVFPCQLGHGLARGVAFGDLAALACIEGGGPAELLALLACLEDAGLGGAMISDRSNSLMPPSIVAGDFTPEVVMLTMRPKRRAIMPSMVARIRKIGVSMLASTALIQSSRSTLRKSPRGCRGLASLPAPRGGPPR